MPISKARLRISDYNERRKTTLRKHERRMRMVSLSLTSMVDMFAILVIFLLANSATFSEWVQLGHGITLPQAKASDVPPKAATLQISRSGVYADTKLLIGVAQLQQSVDPIKKYLAGVDKKGGYINIVADTKLPFGVMKRVIGACQDSGFGNVNLAVQPKAGSI